MDRPRERSDRIAARRAALSSNHVISATGDYQAADRAQGGRPWSVRAPDHDNTGKDIVQTALVVREKRHEKNRRKHPAEIEEHGVDRGDDERHVSAARKLHLDIHHAHADRAAVAAGYAEAVIEERSEEHTSELQSRQYLVCRLL